MAACAGRQQQRSRRPWQATATALLLLLLAAAAAQPAAAAASVPGQAFHDWRTALIKTYFTPPPLNRSDEAALALSLANPQAWRAAQQRQWVSIVGARERLSELPGPPSRNTTHPAAATRLRLARLLLADVARAAAAAANTSEEEGPDGSGQGAAAPPASAKAAAGIDARLLQQLTRLMHSQPHLPAATPPAQLEAAMTFFVQRGPTGRLLVDGKPWLLKGLDVPDALQLAGGSEAQRGQLLHVLDRAHALQLNTLRVRAFADGSPSVGSATRTNSNSRSGAAATLHRPHHHLALQPAPGVLNATLLRVGLDWLVHEAGLRGLRLLLVLTGGPDDAVQGGGGGSLSSVQQYVEWVDPGLTLTDFYSNDTIKSLYLDYVAGLLDHTSSLSGLPLRHDPLIAGWQVADGATHPGHPASQALLAWLKQMGEFVKRRAPHQLLLSGAGDAFGRNSPHHLAANPPAQVFSPVSRAPHAHAAPCLGADFFLHNQPPEFDAAVTGVFPDLHLACEPACKLRWAREWIRAHLRDALKMGSRPLILGGVGALPAWSPQLLALVSSELKRGLQRGHPVGGVLLSGLAHPDTPDATGWGLHLSAAAGAQRLPLPNLNQQAVADVRQRRFMEYDLLLACQASEEQQQAARAGSSGSLRTALWRSLGSIARLPDVADAAAASPES